MKNKKVNAKYEEILELENLPSKWKHKRNFLENNYAFSIVKYMQRVSKSNYTTSVFFYKISLVLIEF